MSSGLDSSRTMSCEAKRTVCDGWSTHTTPATCGMSSSRRTEWVMIGWPPSSRNCLDSPSGKPMRMLSPAAATTAHTDDVPYLVTPRPHLLQREASQQHSADCFRFAG